MGLDGRMNNAANAFHWLVEHYRTKAGWSAQSYRFGSDLLRRAKVVVVYDLHAPQCSGDEPFGPRWVSLMDPARVPLALTRHYGKGEVVFAQLGGSNIRPQAGAPTGDIERAPLYLREFAKNLVDWAEQAPQSNGTGAR